MKFRIADYAIIILAIILSVIFLLTDAYVMKDIFVNSWSYFLKASGWIVLGFLLGGLAIVLTPQKIFVNLIGGTDVKSIGYASVLGILVDVCSHGALAIGMSLYKKGASVASTVTFLLATPWLGAMAFFTLIGLVGFRLTMIMTVSSLITAFTVGNIIGIFERRGWFGKYRKKIKKKKINYKKEIRTTFRKFTIKETLEEAYDLFDMIWKWLFIGFFGAGIVLTIISESTIQSLMGHASATSLPLTLVLSMIIEVCSEGTAPLAAAFYDKGASIGAFFVFLMAGVASDYTEIGVIADVIGKRAAIVTLVVSTLTTLLIGYIINFIFYL